MPNLGPINFLDGLLIVSWFLGNCLGTKFMLTFFCVCVGGEKGKKWHLSSSSDTPIAKLAFPEALHSGQVPSYRDAPLPISACVPSLVLFHSETIVEIDIFSTYK